MRKMSRFNASSRSLLSLILLFVLPSLLGAVSAKQKENKNDPSSIPVTVLSSGNVFPLVGFGVGNLQHELIAGRIAEALADDKKIILFDTAHASSNEITVRKGIENGLRATTSSSYQGPIHVVTKVWYTHLGYERTKISVKASLEALAVQNENYNSGDIRVHILLHWPRCDDSIPWMNCQAEEDNLPDYVKQAGPPPHLHKDTAFLESWRALEDIYTGKIKLGKQLPKVESIGVSNFYLDDMQALEHKSTILPHILQGNIWSYLFDPHLMDYLEGHGIHFQAYNVMNGILYNGIEHVPNAVETLEQVAQQISERASTGITYGIAQILLKWLIQNNVSVIPRTTSLEHLKENSAAFIAHIPDLDNQEIETVRRGVAALLTKKDLTQTVAQFTNQQTSGFYNLYWINEELGEEIPVKVGLAPGEVYSAYTKRGHKFALYNADTNSRNEVQVTVFHGQEENFEL